MTVERVSYEAMTPMAARGLLESIHWLPTLRWTIQRIHVLRPVRLLQVFNEVSKRRTAIVLDDVAYVVEASLALTERAGPNERALDHYKRFAKKVWRQSFHHVPTLGSPECPCEVAILEPDAPLPPSSFPNSSGRVDLGWMLHDLDYGAGKLKRFFRAAIVDGSIEVPLSDDPGLVA